MKDEPQNLQLLVDKLNKDIDSKRIELSNELVLSFLKEMNIPGDSVITHCERNQVGIVIYIHSPEFEETKEGFIPDSL